MSAPWRGTLLHIHTAPAASYEMEEQAEATLVAGRGIEGDRYFLGNGTYSQLPAMREITLIEAEVLDALARNDPPLQDGPIVLSPHEHRRNLTVRGVPLGHLVGRRFASGRRCCAARASTFRASTWSSCWVGRCTCRCTTAPG